MANDKSYRAFNTHFVLSDNRYTCGTCSRLFPNTGKCSYVSFKHKYNEPVNNCRKFTGPMDPRDRDYAEVYRIMTGRRFYYILTAIFEILKINPETSDVYQTIKGLIRKVRENDETVKSAVHYDTYGEELAENLVRDTDRESLCENLLVNYLSKVYVMIKNNDEVGAISLYSNMVNFLQTRYEKEPMITENIFENKKLVISR